MKTTNWFGRLVKSFGDNEDAVNRARQESKHERGNKPARNARAKRRQARKAARGARKAHRGR